MQDGSHPRPQLLRGDWTSLDGEWRFAYDDADEGLRRRWHADDAAFDRSIRVPFPPESPASGIGDTGHHPVVWYRRSFDVAAAPAGRRCLIHFGAVDHEAAVWVDGQLAGRHTGGYSPFTLDVTELLDGPGPHELVVRAADDPRDAEAPRGKQDWLPEPHAIWYHRSTGIWQTVWLETVAPQHIAALHWTSDIEAATVRGELRLARRPSAPLTLQAEWSLGEELLAASTLRLDSDHAAFGVELPALRDQHGRDRLLWSPGNPVLIDVTLRLMRGDDVIDEAASYLGIRSTAVDDASFLLNGYPVYLRAVLEQGYWPESHFTAPSDDARRAEVQLIKDLGFNAARIHQKAEDPRFLFWADRLGLMIWAETAAAAEFTPRAVRLLTAEWSALVERDRSHPCIVAWVPMNESWGVGDVAASRPQQHFVQAMASLTRALDPTRPVVSNDGWEHVDSDILTLHDYSSDPEELLARYGTAEALAAALAGRGPHGRRILVGERAEATAAARPVMISEFGGIAHRSAAGAWGYTVVDSDDEYRQRLEGLFAAIRRCAGIRGFCYTQLSDTLQESNGLLTGSREPKLPVPVLRAIVTGGPSR